MKIVTREEEFFKKHGFRISYDDELALKNEGLTQSEAMLLGKEMRKIARNVRGILKRVRTLATKNSQKPAFQYLLALAYTNAGQHEKSREICRKIIAAHPEYVPATTELIRSLGVSEQFEEISSILNGSMSIADLRADRTYHFSEIPPFYRSIFYYFLEYKEDEQKAAEVLEIMKDADLNSNDTRRCMSDMEFMGFLDDFEFDEGEVPERSIPQFNFPKEINALYNYPFSDDYTVLKNILALPREKVIDDLEMVLRDGLDNYEYWNAAHYSWDVEEDDLQFVLHAIFLLTELKSSKSLSIVWEILQNKREIGDFYLNDHITETLWLDFYLLARNDISFLKNCLLQKEILPYGAAPVYMSIGHTLHNEPHRRGEYLTLIEELIDTFLERKKQGLEVNDTLVTFIIIEGVDAGLTELEEKIALLGKANLIDSTITEAKDLIDDLKNEKSDFRKLVIHPDIYARYEEQYEIIKSIEKRQAAFMKEEETLPRPKTDFFSNLSSPAASSKKVGRNEPCPCGSGKKYKKCCLNK